MSPIETTDGAPIAPVEAAPKRSRADINRANAQHSTGPRTPEGKRRSSQNATKRGLYAESNLIRGESADAFEKLSLAFFDDLNPKGATECELVHDLADAAWRKRRYRHIEAEVINEAFDQRDAREEAGEAPGFLSGPIGRQLADASRFGARAQREFRTALRELSALRRDRDRSAALAAARAWKGHEGVTDSWARQYPMSHTGLMRAYASVHPANYFEPDETDAPIAADPWDDAAEQQARTKPAELATMRVEPLDLTAAEPPAAAAAV